MRQPASPWHPAHGLLLGLAAALLLSGIAPRWTWYGSLALLTGFLAVVSYRWMTGWSDCGCFPGIRVPPWATATMDLGFLATLVAAGPLPRSYVLGRTRWLVSGAIIALVAVCACWTGWEIHRARTAGWDPPLDRGRWKVVAVRDGCEHCSAALTWLIPVANASPGEWGFVSVSGQAAWLHRLGLSPQVPTMVRVDPWQEVPQGLHLREGRVVGTFPIPNQGWEE